MHTVSRGLKGLALTLAAVLAAALLGGCAPQNAYKSNAALDTTQKVRLIVAGRTKDFRALEVIGQQFTNVYPNCTVEYENLQDFDETLPKRVVADSERVDLFLSPNMQAGSETMKFALDLLPTGLDLSGTFPGLTDNFKYVESDTLTHLYSVPMGGEMRGLFVNTTLLSSLGIAVPTNRAELLSACAKLRDAGYIPLQDNPGSFGQRLVFPYMVHLVVSDEKHRQMVAQCEEGTAELFEDTLSFLYGLTAERYYDYKRCETEYKRFLDLTDEGMARSFLNIAETETGYEKLDDLGGVPFMTSANSLAAAIDKVKEDYHSAVEYQFILAPVSDEGGYAHLSPCNGLAVNKNSEHIDWCLEFLRFFFTPEINRQFAAICGIAPNTADALEVIGKQFGIPAEQISQPSDVSFAYNLFSIVNPVLVSATKANNPKYMREDENGNTVMYGFDTYMDSLRNVFAEQRVLLEGVKP